MNSSLPTSLDMTSAYVLGFDATSYINDESSTLCKRLNFPSCGVGQDYFTTELASVSKKKKFNFASLISSLATVTGIGILGFLGYKNRSKFPKINIKLNDNLLKNINNIKTATTGFLENVVKRLKSYIRP